MIDKKIIISKAFNIKSEDLQSKGESLVYDREFGSVSFGYKNGIVDLNLADKSGVKIPNSFVHDLSGKMPLDKFIDKNLDKTLKSWNKLSDSDRSLYKLLSAKGTKSELLDQLKNQFKISNENIKVAPDNRFVVQTEPNKQEYFEGTFKGLKKMIKTLSSL